MLYLHVIDLSFFDLKFGRPKKRVRLIIGIRQTRRRRSYMEEKVISLINSSSSSREHLSQAARFMVSIVSSSSGNFHGIIINLVLTPTLSYTW